MDKIKCEQVYVLRSRISQEWQSPAQISARYDELLVECPEGHIEVWPSDERLLVPIYHDDGTIRCLKPWSKKDSTMMMAGGNYAEAGDSRVTKYIFKGLYGAVAIHDEVLY